MQDLSTYLKYIAKLTFGAAVVTLSAYSAKDDVTLVDIVTACKLFSLFTLLVVNGEIAKGIDRGQKDLKAVNYVIIVVVIFVTIVTFVKYIGLDFNDSKIAAPLKEALAWTYRNIQWMSAAPLVAYALLDSYIAFWRSRSSVEEKLVALRFFVFADLVCIFPLFIVYAMTYAYSKVLAEPLTSLQAFQSGSIAIVLLASAIATKAVNLAFARPAGATIGTRS